MPPACSASCKTQRPETLTWQIVETNPTPFKVGELETEARASDVVIAVGGDGTVAERSRRSGMPAYQSLFSRAARPMSLRRSSGFLAIPGEVARMVFGRHAIHTMDAATCNDRLFLHMAGAGFDSRIFDQTDPGLKRRVGWLAYLPGAARSLRLPPPGFTFRPRAPRSTSCRRWCWSRTAPVLSGRAWRCCRTSHPMTAGWTLLLLRRRTRPGSRVVLARFFTRSMDRSPHVMHVRAGEFRSRPTHRCRSRLTGMWPAKRPRDGNPAGTGNDDRA